MHILPFQAYIPDLNKVKFDDEFYQAMREDFNLLLDQGLFKLAIKERPGFYMLEIKSPTFKATGLICLTSIEDYKKHRILKHEQTIAKKERMHRQLLQSRTVLIKPAALLIHYDSALEQIFKEHKKRKFILRIKYPDPEIIHTVWPISAPRTVSHIIQLFLNKVDKALIADGHHRIASLAALHTRKNPQHILSVYFAPDEMRVSTFFRIIAPLKSTPPHQILTKLQSISSTWQLVDQVRPLPSMLHVIYQKKIYKFTFKSKSKEVIPIVFSRLITRSIFRIHEESKSKRMKYMEASDDAQILKDIILNHKKDFIFILPPLTTRQVLDHKKLFPPKSTLFNPRILNGLVIAYKAIP